MQEDCYLHQYFGAKVNHHYEEFISIFKVFLR